MPYPNFERKELQSILARTTTPCTFDSGRGLVVASEFGGRILGLYPNPDGPNVLWVNPDLEEVIFNKGWKMGGERLWLSPEREYNYLKPQTFDQFTVQSAYDPGNFIRKDDSFVNSFSITNYLAGETYNDCIAKRTIEPLNDPYSTGLAFAGARIDEKYTLTKPDLAICCWSIAQCYVNSADTPATAFFPIKTGRQPLHYFGPIPGDRIETNNGYVRFKIDSNHICKLAISPEDTIEDVRCRTLLIGQSPMEKTWFLVAKYTDNLPQDQTECVDPAKSDPTGPKGCVQSYNHGPEGIEREVFFGEIELQFSKGKTVGTQTVSVGSHELITYSGKKGDMIELAGHLLNLKTRLSIY